MAFLKTWHTGFTVSDLARSCNFFADVLGFEIVAPAVFPDETISIITGVTTPGIRVAYANAPDHCIELLQFGWQAPKDDGQNVVNVLGRAHLAFQVDDLDGTLVRAAAWGWHPINPPVQLMRGAMEGWRVCYVIDADGLVVEFGEPQAS